MSALLVAVPLLLQGAIGVRLESLRSELDDWPTPRLEEATVRALERTAKLKWAEHYLAVGEDIRGDVALKGVLAPLEGGPRVRFTWKLETQNCPALNDAVGFDFNSSSLTDAGLDAMMRALTKRAARLVERAKEKRSDSCIDPADLPTPEELRRRPALTPNGVTPQPQPSNPPPPVRPAPTPFLPGPSIPVRNVR